MKTFPNYSIGLKGDPRTRRIWYSLAVIYDFESHDGMTELNLYQQIFKSHFYQIAVIFLWVSGNLFHVGWQGNFEEWIQNPLTRRPLAHAIFDPHFSLSVRV